MNFKTLTLDEILTRLPRLKVGKYTEIEYNGEFYPVITERGLKFAVIQSGYTVYKALSKTSNLIEYFSKAHEFPFPSFYGTKETAKIYRGKRMKIRKFHTKRPVKLLILNDPGNIIELAKIFSQTSGVKGILKKSRKEAVRELLLATGFGMHCLQQEEYRKELEKELDIRHTDFKLNLKLCKKIPNEQLKRLSLYSIDLQLSRNICIALKKFGSDGYIAKEMAAVSGEVNPIFHKEMMFCFTGDVLKTV